MTTVIDPDARGTQHCETTALGVLLRHQGLDLTEPMLFGLGSGLSFIYWDSKSMGFPFLGGRVKPFDLTRNLTTRLGLELLVQETTSPRRAWENVVAPIDAGHPVGLQLDSYHLDYFTSKVHFGGHVVAMYGYDDRDAYLVDTDQQGGTVSTSLTSLAQARAARGPMTAKHRSFTLTAPRNLPSPRGQIIPAITACADAFLNPPIANLGHRGIEKAGKLVRTRRLRGRRKANDPGFLKALRGSSGRTARSSDNEGSDPSSPPPSGGCRVHGHRADPRQGCRANLVLADLKVRQALDTGGDHHRFEALPAYAAREHDTHLVEGVAATVAVHSGSAVLIQRLLRLQAPLPSGEAMRELLTSWQMWRPISPAAPTRPRPPIANIAPHTVVAERSLPFFDPDPLPRRGMQQACEARPATRTLVLPPATLRPKHWQTLTTRAPDRHAHARPIAAQS